MECLQLRLPMDLCRNYFFRLDCNGAIRGGESLGVLTLRCSNLGSFLTEDQRVKGSSNLVNATGGK